MNTRDREKVTKCKLVDYEWGDSDFLIPLMT